MPIPGTAKLVCYGQQHHPIVLDHERKHKGKSRKAEPTNVQLFESARPKRPELRVLADNFQRPPDLPDEVQAQTWALRLVPVTRGRQIGECFGMKDDLHALPFAPAGLEALVDGLPVLKVDAS